MTTPASHDAELWRLRIGPSDLEHVAAVLRGEELPPGYHWAARRELLASKTDRVRATLWPNWGPPR
jgi:hypothetical protein